MTITLDSTDHSTVVVCSICGCQELADSRREGWKVGAAHEQVAHPELVQARDAARTYQKRDTPR